MKMPSVSSERATSRPDVCITSPSPHRIISTGAYRRDFFRDLVSSSQYMYWYTVTFSRASTIARDSAHTYLTHDCQRTPTRALLLLGRQNAKLAHSTIQREERPLFRLAAQCFVANHLPSRVQEFFKDSDVFVLVLR